MFPNYRSIEPIKKKYAAGHLQIICKLTSLLQIISSGTFYDHINSKKSQMKTFNLYETIMASLHIGNVPLIGINNLKEINANLLY